MAKALKVLASAAALCVLSAVARAEIICPGGGTQTEPQTVALIAGQNFYAGTVTVTYDGLHVCVTYQTVDGWQITETHLAIADSLAGIPQTKTGNPQPGKFPYSATHTPPVTTFTYCVPYVATGDVYIATHAVVRQVDASGRVVQGQTAWSGPNGFPGKNWATYLVLNPHDFGCYEVD